MKSVEGIILKKTPRREADSVFTLYTKEHGLMHLQAKGVRKQTAKLKAGLSVFNWVELFYVPAKYLPIATDFKVKDDFKVVKNDIKRLKLASFLAHVMNRVFEPGLSDPAVWWSVLGYFNDINHPDLAREGMIKLVYSWCYRMLVLNGLKPPHSITGNLKSSTEFKNIVDGLFEYHFGINISKLI